MKKIEVNKKTFKDIWKSKKETIDGDFEENDLIKIKYKKQWILCKIMKEEENYFKILLTKHLPY